MSDLTDRLRLLDLWIEDLPPDLRQSIWAAVGSELDRPGPMEVTLLTDHTSSAKRSNRLRGWPVAVVAFALAMAAFVGFGVLSNRDRPTGSRLPPITGNVGVVDGVLPDGTTYQLSGVENDDVATGVFAVITVDMTTGESLPIGNLVFAHESIQEGSVRWNGNVLTVPAGEWTAYIDVYQQVLDRLGTDARPLLTASVAGHDQAGLPVLDLSPPLRFATDEEVPSALEVSYRTFVVRRGCDPSPGVVCSEDRSVQAVPLENVVSLSPGPPPPGLTIISP